MTLDIAAGPASLLQQRTHRHARCWKITRTDLNELYFTDADRTIDFLGDTYAPSGGFSASSTGKEAKLREQASDVRGMISSAKITTSDLRARRYDNASILEYLVDWRYPWAGAFQTTKWRVIETKWNGETWEWQIEGLMRLLRAQAGDKYTQLCPYTLGDGRCRFDLAGATLFNRSVTSVTTQRREIVSAGANGISGTGFNFTTGQAIWTSGSNVGIKSEVQTYNGSTSITFTQKTPFDIAVSDAFNLEPGCLKTASVCKTEFNNFVNHGGDPFIPGFRKLLQSPTTITSGERILVSP